MWYLKFLISLLCFLFSCQVSAQDSVSPEKQVLIQRVISLWNVENLAISMAQRPAFDALQQSRVLLQGRVSAEKQASVLKDLTQDVNKFIDDATPIVREVAERSKPEIISPFLAKNFTELELRQLIDMLESPVKKKFEALVPEIEASFGKKVAARAGLTINPKLEALSKSISSKLRASVMAPQ